MLSRPLQRRLDWPGWFAASALLAGGLVAACTSPTEPTPAFRVEIFTRNPDAPQIIETPNGTGIACIMGFLAQGRGKGDATWVDATFRWYAGIDRSLPIDTQVVTQSADRIWFRDDITAVGADSSWWTFSGGVPFELEASFRYRVASHGRIESVSARLPCGVPPVAGAAAPTVRLLSVTATDDTIEAGDTIRVSYEVAGASGLWESGVALGGPFTTQRGFAERNATSGQRTVAFVVPTGSVSGRQVGVAVYAYDVGMRLADTSTTTALRVVDVTPPALSVDFLPAQLTAGETLTAAFRATDNNALRWVHYELGTPAMRKDSVTVGGTDRSANVAIIVPPDWAGRSADLRVWAVDSAGNIGGFAASADSAYGFYETVAGPLLIPDVSVGGEIQDVHLDAARQRIYLGVGGLSRLVSVDYASMTAGQSLTLPFSAAGMDQTVSGDSMLIAHGGADWLSVVDLDAFVWRDSLPIPSLDSLSFAGQADPSPTGVSVAANGLAVVQLYLPAGGIRTVTVDLATRTSRWRPDAGAAFFDVDPWWRWMGATRDRTRVLVVDRDCVRFYLASSDSFTPCHREELTGFNSGPSFPAGSDRIGIAQRVLDGAGAAILPMQIGHSLAMSEDGQTAFVLSGRSLYRIRVADGRYLRRMELPFFAEQIEMVPGGGALIAIRRYEGLIARIDLTSF